MDTQESRSALAPDDWWANWLRAHPVGGALLAGLLATHVTTMIGYYLVGIGLPELRWADFNGFFLGTIAEPIGSAGSFFGGFTLHTIDGLMFALLYAAILGLWFGLGERVGRIGFYLLFAFAVTASVQLVGVYLVFTTLIVPALATRRLERRRLATAYGLGAAGYALGLALSLASDLPPGPLIVCTMTALGVALFLSFRRRIAA